MPHTAIMSLSNLAQKERTINRILVRLEGVRSIGPGKWMAKCPAHPDKRPSLSIREADDGRVLIHCFAGCDTRAILEAIGLDYSDLFPGRYKTTKKERCERVREKARIALEKALTQIAENAIIEEIRLAESLLWKHGGWKEIMDNGPNSEALAWLAHRLTYLDYLWDKLIHNGLSSDILHWMRKEGILP